ncbi:MAG: protein kinase [Gemmataceae bacterium]
MSASSDSFSPSFTLLEQFDLAWQHHGYPELAEYLPPPDDPARLATLADLVRIDLEYRWKAENGCPVETYLVRYPELTSDTELVLDLIAWEYELRRRTEPALDVNDFAQRFPHQAGQLARRFAAIATEVTPVRRSMISLKMASPSVPGYEIIEELGRGGMGVVYKARQISLDRVVALKVIRAEFSDHPTMRQRFTIEARALAQLQHVGIVRVYECGIHGNQPFFVLEYVEGGNLSEFLRKRPLEPLQAAQLVARLADAVQHAHDKGIIHRDLKPANVLLARSAHLELEDPSWARVADFGLARSMDDCQRTRAGSYLGTPAYMSPEQARGEIHGVGPATDVFGLGTILYECLTGHPPLRGDSYDAVLHQARKGEVLPPSATGARIPWRLERICMRALHPEASQRYATARELSSALRAFAQSRWSTHWSAAVLIVLVALLGLNILQCAGFPRSSGAATQPGAAGQPGQEGPRLEANVGRVAFNHASFWATTHKKAQWVNLFQSPELALPVRNGELMRFLATLDRPGHVYILYLDGSNGQISPMYPWNWDELTSRHPDTRPQEDPPVIQVSSPRHKPGTSEKKGQLGWKMEGTSSVDFVLLLARETPLNVPLAPLIRMPRAPVKMGSDHLIVRSWPEIPNLVFDFAQGRRDNLRGLVFDPRGPAPQAEAANDHLRNLIAPLIDHFDSIVAFQFPHEGN